MDPGSYSMSLEFGKYATVHAAAAGCPKCLLLREITGRFGEPGKLIVTGMHSNDYSRERFHIGVTYWGNKKQHKHLEAFAQAGTPKLLPELPYRIAPRHAWSWESLSRAKRWITTCSTTHESCRQPPTTPLPKRVLDVSGSTVRLVETDENQSGRYIALSHCWGKSRAPCLTKRATKDDNMRGIAWEMIPNTFRDAIQVARVLEARFLWIDSLCIVQDDENDWWVESAKMASVYRNAYVTISATASPGDDAGLWPRTPNSRRLVEKIVVEHEGAKYDVFLRDYDETEALHMVRYQNDRVWESVPKTCPLMLRGWCFQERILSPRLLHFGYGELLWQCPELSTCECCFRRSHPAVFVHGPRQPGPRLAHQLVPRAVTLEPRRSRSAVEGAGGRVHAAGTHVSQGRAPGHVGAGPDVHGRAARGSIPRGSMGEEHPGRPGLAHPSRPALVAPAKRVAGPDVVVGLHPPPRHLRRAKREPRNHETDEASGAARADVDKGRARGRGRGLFSRARRADQGGHGRQTKCPYRAPRQWRL